MPALSAAAGCTLQQFAQMPVTMVGAKPVVSVQINGRQTPLIADSGAFFSILTPASAAELGLALYPAPFNLVVAGIGGNASIRLTTVRQFAFSGVTVPNVQFIVGGSEPGAGAAGTLGQNVLRIADAEYDLGDGVIRLLRPRNCGRAALAYWAAAPSSTPVSVLRIEPSSPGAPWTIGTARLNGAPIRVLFDTGSAVSLLTLRAAARAGVRPTDAGVVPAGLTHGVGRGTVRTWIAPFQSFQIGDEQILHTRLRIGDLNLNDVDMLLGIDFFLSHRIYVSNSQHQLYFTYNGGPVFNLGAPPAPASAVPATATATPPAPALRGEPTDAADFARRGNAFAARREFAQAIADLTRACQLSPNDPEYFYQRGLVYRDDRQPAVAMTDFDRALMLQPDDVEALVARAQLHLVNRDRAAAGADLDAAARHAPGQADILLAIADAYQRADLPAAAIAQYDLWIAAHAQDAKMGGALNGRCRARALAGRELTQALADCNAALKMDPGVPQFLDSRGLVRLRLGRLDQSIADFDAALRQEPRNAWSLYGRGVDELRKGMKGEGERDIAVAVALSPSIVEQASGHGITP
ncbi:MAG TPA: aspartyl protease family protein [Steroidobacteraceae bacterium]|nr:aspartyl protease family protein [Steroidobacteraceae bacterium]